MQFLSACLGERFFFSDLNHNHIQTILVKIKNPLQQEKRPENNMQSKMFIPKKYFAKL